MAFKELNEKQLKAIELLIKGDTIVSIAKKIGVSRNSITAWKNDETFKAEMCKQVQGLKSKVDEKLLISLEPLLDKLVDIALNAESDKTALDAIIYAINRVCGTPTSKVQDVTENDEKKAPVDIDAALENIKKSREMLN